MSSKLSIVLIVLALGLAGCKKEDGTVEVSPEAKQGAQRAADTVSDAAANTSMTAKIQSAWQSANSLKIEDMNVDTKGKDITLRGYVDSQAMKDTAERIAKDQAGEGYTINNEIAIKNKP